ncbi:MAG TPA: heat-inducible transcriptional repressor HrcA, partial [Dehalococcoidia bacterium]|nr:heat-inducible transcriptional repressor HrcA [Dehalococcoidia bacterium]
RVIVADYITGAMPVASKAIAYNYDLRVSPATVRNDVAYLEEEGYIMHPHPSAGAIPTDKAYRYYVEMISRDVELPLAEQYWIYELFQGAKEEFEQCLKLAAALLAHFVRNVAVVTPVKAPRCRFKHLDLVALQDFVVLLVLVLYQARVRQKTLFFNKRLSQDDLTMMANKLNSAYAEMAGSEIPVEGEELSPEERRVTECIVDMITAEDRLGYGKPYLEGLYLMLSQPEFANNPKALNLLELLEGEDWVEAMFQPRLATGEIKVIIGGENPDEALQDLSLILSEYGVPDKAGGIIGVIGPKRMDYARAISSVNCLSSLLSKSVARYI